MKTLANCNPYEFLVQTNKIRKSTESWLSLTKVLEIRRKPPKLRPDMSADEKRAAIMAQARRNVSEMLTAVLENHPKETAELLCLLCFIDPSEMDKHTMAELLGAANEIIGNEEVLSFFSSLARLVLTDGSGPVKQSDSTSSD